MAKNASLGRNAALNGLRTVFNLLFPLITFPYVSRTLSVEKVGVFHFSDSIVSYFMMLAALGIYTYAVREGAKIRGDRAALSRFASEVFSINLASMLASFALLGALLMLVPRLQGSAPIIAILSLQILFNALGTEWLYALFEDFAYITFRSIAFQAVSLILLFLLVHGPEDLPVYAGIVVFACAGSNLLNFVLARRMCDVRPVLSIPWKRHLPPILIIFSTTVAISIYTCSDTTMLGFMRGEHEVGIYAVSSKIYGLAKMLLSSVLIVAVPKLSLLLAEKKAEEYNGTLSAISGAVSMLLFPVALMLFLLAEDFVLLLSDATYLAAASSLRLLCIALLFCLIGWIANDCVLIPSRMEKIVLISTVASATLNIALNFVLIPFLGADGAAISTIAAEATVMGISVWHGRKVAALQAWLLPEILRIAAACLPVAGICLWLRGLGLGAGKTVLLALPLCAAACALALILLRSHMAWQGLARLRAGRRSRHAAG